MIRALIIVVVSFLAACGGGGGGPTIERQSIASYPSCADLESGATQVTDRGADTDITCRDGKHLYVGASFSCDDGTAVAYNDVIIWHSRDGVVRKNMLPKGFTFTDACAP